MADDNHCAFEISQKAFKPCDCVNVKVVCRLVKEEHIALRQQQLCKAESLNARPADFKFADEAISKVYFTENPSPKSAERVLLL